MKDSQCRNLIEIMRSYSEPHSSYFYSTIYYERHKTFISTGSRLCGLRDLGYVYSIRGGKEVTYGLTEKGEQLDLSTATFPIVHKKVKIRSSIEESEIKKENKELNGGFNYMKDMSPIYRKWIDANNEGHKEFIRGVNKLHNELIEHTPPIQPSLWGQIKALFSHTKGN